MVPPQLCLLVYKPYLHPLTILVISTINHRIHPLLRQLITGLLGKSPETMGFSYFFAMKYRVFHGFPATFPGDASSRILHGVLRCVGHGLSVPWFRTRYDGSPGDDDEGKRLGRWEVHILVGGLEHEFYFPFHIWDNPSHWLSYFSDGLKPPSSICFINYSYNQLVMVNIWNLYFQWEFHHQTSELCNIPSGKYTKNDGTSQFYSMGKSTIGHINGNKTGSNWWRYVNVPYMVDHIL